MTNLQKVLLFSIVANTFASQHVLAQCAACTDTIEFGAGVVESAVEATGNTLETAESVTEAYADTSKALYDTSDEVVAAIIAGSGEVTTEIVRSSEINTRLMEAMTQQMEQLYRSRMIADANIKAAETHGAVNVHSSSCEPFSRTRNVTLTRELLKEYREQQINDRADDVRYRGLDYDVTSWASLTDNIYYEGDATLAMAQVSLITGENSFAVSPDTISALAQRGLGNASDESIQMLSGWLRASAAGLDVSSQIAKRTRPAADKTNPNDKPVSVLEELWIDVENGISPGALLEDGTASKVKLLRAIARREAVSNRIKMEQLENAMAIARMSASELGYLTEDAMRKAKPGINQTITSGAVRKGDDDE